MVFQRVSLFVERVWKAWASSWGIRGDASPENVWVLHFLNCQKCTNLPIAHFTPFMEGEGRNFTIISTSDGQNSRVTFQKSANVWEIPLWISVSVSIYLPLYSVITITYIIKSTRTWSYIEMHETHTQCMKLESSGSMQYRGEKGERSKRDWRERQWLETEGEGKVYFFLLIKLN